MHAHDTAITLFQVQPDKHIQKPPKDSLDLTNAPNLNTLFRQKIHFFHYSQKLPLSESFRVQNELYLEQKYKNEFEKHEFIISSSQSIILQSKDSIISSWAGIRALLSNIFVPRTHVGFLPSFASAGTEYSTVFCAMKNFTKLLRQLKQDALSLFCDEGVFRIVVNIVLQKQYSFEV